MASPPDIYITLVHIDGEIRISEIHSHTLYW